MNPWVRVNRSTFAALGMVVCLLGIWVAGKAGLSRWHARNGRKAGLVSLVDQAVRLSPADPEAHYARARVLMKAERLAEGVKEFERAVALRPRDHFLWLRLGHARGKVDDHEGALAAYREAVRLAPYYAQPRWYLGYFLLKAGRRDEAFADLRRAAASDPKHLPDLIGLAWKKYEGDARAVQQAVRPQTDAARLALARFFVERGEVTEALELFRAAGSASDKDRRAFIAALLAAERFKESYEVWSSGREHRGGGYAAISDGSFEGRIIHDGPGFGWQLARDLQAVRISLDADQPRSGAYCLRVEFNGNSNPSARIISQLVLVEPNSRYRLSFAARTRGVVTGGLPMATVTDAGSGDARVLAESKILPQGTSGWQDYFIEFTTAGRAGAVLINIQRQNCTTSPCPAFGHAWFDDFSLRKL